MNMLDRYQVITTDFKNWQVLEAGKVVAICKGKKAKEDAERVGKGLIALEENEILKQQLLIMTDVVRKNNLWEHFRGIFVRFIPKEGGD